MLEKARGRLSEKLNVSFAVEDGQSLTFPDEQFDAVLCDMGLMLFPDPARGVSEFRRVLREDRWAAVSVNTVPERAFATCGGTPVGARWHTTTPPAASWV
jgi:ubiquinone/menaquinone biosynthesis C-methylase UbiE